MIEDLPSELPRNLTEEEMVILWRKVRYFVKKYRISRDDMVMETDLTPEYVSLLYRKGVAKLDKVEIIYQTTLKLIEEKMKEVAIKPIISPVLNLDEIKGLIKDSGFNLSDFARKHNININNLHSYLRQSISSENSINVLTLLKSELSKFLEKTSQLDQAIDELNRLLSEYPSKRPNITKVLGAEFNVSLRYISDLTHKRGYYNSDIELASQIVSRYTKLLSDKLEFLKKSED